MTAMNVHLRIEASPTKCPCESSASLRFYKFAIFSVLLILNVRAEVNTRYSAQKQEVKSDDEVADNQYDQHKHI